MIQFSDNFTFAKLLRFTLPSIVMLIFTSVYTIVDGFFVSNFAGKAEFTALNFIFPLISILGSFGFLFGTGGGALTAKTMGEGNREKACQTFSLIIYTSIGFSVVAAAAGLVAIRPITIALGAEGELLENSISYGRILLFALPALILQYEFQIFFPTAGKPQLGLYFTLSAGLTNIILDALFVAVFHWGLEGAAAATALSQCVGGFLPLIYFAGKNSSHLKLTATKIDLKAVFQAVTNGSSELLSNISMSLVGILYNIQLLKYAGENGVAAYGVLMYVNFIFSSTFIGYSVGSAPLFSYHLGAKNWKQLHNLLCKSLAIILSVSLLMVATAFVSAETLTRLFVGYDQELTDFFTALNNGLISAVISFLRTLCFQTAAVLILPRFWGVDGIWFSAVGAEIMAAVISACFLIAKRKEYHY